MNWITIAKKTIYRVPVQPGSIMTEHLGAMKLRTDGRWDWWRWPSRYHEWNAPAQGVVDDEDSARLRIMDGWT
jgi:hypothetical protein